MKENLIKDAMLHLISEVRNIYGSDIMNNLVMEFRYDEEPDVSIMLKFKEITNV